MTFLGEKIPFSRQKFLLSFFCFFLSSTRFFRFSFAFPRFPLSFLCEMSYLTLSSQEKHLFYSVDTFTRIRQHYTSLNIGGTNAWAVPHLKFWGDRPPSPP